MRGHGVRDLQRLFRSYRACWRGSLMAGQMADGIGALDLGGGTLFSFFYAEVRTRGNNRVKVAAYLIPVHSRNVQRATNVRVRSEKELTRKQARTHSVNLCPFVLVHKTQTKCFCHPLYL
eukprot:scaffold26410_cov146-Isochrysis_galbana.AAC.1